MEKLQYKLEVFEGPMDLLLQLISKKKVSINDVPLMEIIEQYLDYVRQMQEDNLDVSSEFLEMAARPNRNPQGVRWSYHGRSPSESSPSSGPG